MSLLEHFERLANTLMKLPALLGEADNLLRIKQLDSSTKVQRWKKVELADAPHVLIFHSCAIFF